MVSLRKVKIAAISLLVCVVLTLLSLSMIFLYYLSYIITSPGSVLLFLISLWLLLRLAVKILVFPGSCWFWKRSIEASFCVEMSNQVYYKVRDLRLYLQSIQSQDHFSYQTNSSALIDSLTERLTSVKECAKLSKAQEALYRRLEEMKNLLQETIVIINSADSFNMWEWLQTHANLPEPNNIVYEDYPDCVQAKKVIRLCTELEESLYKSCGNAKIMQKVRRWAFDDTLGSIHYLRGDLLKRFNCEQIWVQCDKSKIDW